MGDYDFNDVVVDYHFNTVTNSSNKVVENLREIYSESFGCDFPQWFRIPDTDQWRGSNHNDRYRMSSEP